ncbi:MAG: signal peptidase I [Flavobacteriales bacterium]
MKNTPALLREWGKALALAVALLLVLHFFVLRWVTVANTSMYSTLLPGDMLLVERWAVYTGFDRGDIAVLRDPVQDDRAMFNRRLLVKRIVGLPGDEVELRKGELFVNGISVPPSAGETRSWSIRLRPGHNVDTLVERLGLPEGYSLPGNDLIDLPLNVELATMVKKMHMVAALAPHANAKGSPDHIFPFSPDRPWNNDDYGPLRVPAAGDTVNLSPFTLPMYDRIISRYETNTVEVVDRKLLVNGDDDGKYRVRANYYFVLGDARDASSDSRYWGFVPADHLVGRAAIVLFNTHVGHNILPGSRTLRSLAN